MKKIIILLIICFIVQGCKKSNDIMNTPIKAKSFTGFMFNLQKICSNLDNTTCEYLMGYITLTLPVATSNNYILQGDEIKVSEKIFEEINGKTPNELIQIYINKLIDNLNKSQESNTIISKNLDTIYERHMKTKKYAKDIIIENIEVVFEKNMPTIHFSLKNNSEFNIEKVTGEVEFFTSSDTFLGRSKVFLYNVSPALKSFSVKKIFIKVDTLSKESKTMIKVAKNLKVKLLISALQVVDKSGKRISLVLSLPNSYYNMRELIDESQEAYNKTLESINKIKIK